MDKVVDAECFHFSTLTLKYYVKQYGECASSVAYHYFNSCYTIPPVALRAVIANSGDEDKL